MINKKRGAFFGIFIFVLTFIFFISTINLVSAAACYDDGDCPINSCSNSCTLNNYGCVEGRCVATHENCPCSGGSCITKTEICNSIDDDCDGLIDANDPDVGCCVTSDCKTNEYCSSKSCVSCDKDKDGYNSIICGGNDCHDSNANIHPGGIEICNSFDDDCDGLFDEGKGECISSQAGITCEGNVRCSSYPQSSCPTSVGCFLSYGECKKCVTPLSCTETSCGYCEYVPAITEAECDLNCECLPGEHACTCNFNYYSSPLCVGYPACESGDGCYTDSPNLNGCFWDWPNTGCASNLDLGTCNSASDCSWNCCNYVNCYLDSDNDGFGNKLGSAVQSDCGGACSTGYISNNKDCNDGNNLINPNSMEICNSIDDDCDGLIDAQEQQIICCSDTDCSGTQYCSDGECFEVILNPHVIWQSKLEATITEIELKDANPLAEVKLVLVDGASISGLYSSTYFTIQEIDVGEGLLNGNDQNIRIIQATVNGNNLEAIWQINSTDLESSIHFLDNEEDNIFEFQIIINPAPYERFESPILLATKTFSTCGDGFQNYGEEGIDCGEVCGNTCAPASCFDRVQNNDETSVDCGGSCDACVKEVLWTSPEFNYSEYNDSIIRYLTVADIVAKKVKFRMVSQPVTSDTEEFVLKEDDTLGDDTIQDNLFGSYDTNGNLVYLWTPEISDFWTAGLTETIYGFYFEVDGLTSTNLLIELDSGLPTCNDKIMNGDEVDVDCGGSCPDQDCVSVCFSKNVCADYQTSGECNGDICNVAENSLPSIQSGENATCVWNVTCNTKKTLNYNGFEIGSCVYVEDTTTDTCDDGFLSYSWDANVDWANGNTYLTESACELAVGANCTNSEGWHYDPLSYIESCIPGSQTIPCPAQIQLNFFTWKNFFATALLILIIYIILKNFKNVQKSKIGNKKKVVEKKDSKKKVVGKKKVVQKKK